MQKTTGDENFVDKLEKDALDFFLGKTTGNLSPYVYGTPQDENDPVVGGILYNEVLESEENYYLYKYEAKLFQTKGKLLSSIIGSNATFIEFGPGSEKSLRLKTLPLLKTCSDLKGYIGIDISQAFLDKGMEVIRSEFPNIFIDGIQQDFTQLKSLPQFEKSVILFKGSTIGNLTRDEVPIFISSIKKLAAKNHYLLIVHDCNQDQSSLMKAYNNERVAKFIGNIMYRIHRDLDIIGMDPKAFRYQTEWDADNHDLKHVLIATKTQSFDFKGQVIEIYEGQKFHTLSSFKYPVKVFQEMLGLTGYKPIDFVLDESNRLAAHVFQG